MTTEFAVVEKDFGRMRIPLDQLPEYLEAGWREIERVPMSDSAPSPAPEAAEKPKAGRKAVQPEAAEE